MESEVQHMILQKKGKSTYPTEQLWAISECVWTVFDAMTIVLRLAW